MWGQIAGIESTQGDPFAMLDSEGEVKQVWYADDASASGGLASVHSWWDKLSRIGPAFGYFANASKTWLVTKEEHLDRAKEVFHDTNVNITCHGRPYLGAPLGTDDYTKDFVREKVNSWISELRLLADITKSQPHAAYAAFTHGFLHKFSYLCRSIGASGGFSTYHLLAGPLQMIPYVTFLLSLQGWGGWPL